MKVEMTTNGCTNTHSKSKHLPSKSLVRNEKQIEEEKNEK